MHAMLFGFSLGFSLILAIGAQNAFVLKQGLKDEHVLLVCFICALSDALLILIGVSGFHVLVASFPALVNIARLGGATFLFIYGLISFYNALRVQEGLQPSEIKSNSAWQSVLTCLAFTWLNPHVYLDTVVLLGSVSTQFTGQVSWFAAGAMSSSFVFFFALGYGARLLHCRLTICWTLSSVCTRLAQLCRRCAVWCWVRKFASNFPKFCFARFSLLRFWCWVPTCWSGLSSSSGAESGTNGQFGLRS